MPDPTEPRIIAIETSGKFGSVAIGVGDRLLGETLFSTQTEHARELLPALESLCLKQSWPDRRVDECYVSIGPGSFTGLRVAVTFARTLALAHGTRICAIPTLEVIASNCLSLTPPPSPIVVILDAKKDQVFGAAFEFVANRYRTIIEPLMCKPLSLLQAGSCPVFVGEGALHHRIAIENAGAAVLEQELWWPRAKNLFALGREMAHAGRFTPPRDLMPLYIRRPEAEELWERRNPRPLGPSVP